jgi:hypothetical protein
MERRRPRLLPVGTGTIRGVRCWDDVDLGSCRWRPERSEACVSGTTSSSALAGGAPERSEACVAGTTSTSARAAPNTRYPGSRTSLRLRVMLRHGRGDVTATRPHDPGRAGRRSLPSTSVDRRACSRTSLLRPGATTLAAAHASASRRVAPCSRRLGGPRRLHGPDRGPDHCSRHVAACGETRTGLSPGVARRAAGDLASAPRCRSAPRRTTPAGDEPRGSDDQVKPLSGPGTEGARVLPARPACAATRTRGRRRR